MAIPTYAAIDVGSSELAMKIYEVSKTHGIVELTHLRHKISLGTDVFANGQISYKTMSEICRVMKDFKKIMEEYQVSAYHAYGTDALREASNQLILLDQIKLQSDIKVKILSNSEEHFLYYKAVMQNDRNLDTLLEEGALIVNMGGGSVQLSLFTEGSLEFTQNLKLGPSRIQELLHTLEPEIFSYRDLISEYLDKDLNAFSQMFLQGKKIRHIIATGIMVPELMYHIADTQPTLSWPISRKEFNHLDFPIGMSASQNEIILSTTLLLRKLAALVKAHDIYLSSIGLCDSMVVEYAEKKVKLLTGHDFTQDIIATAQNIALRYHVDMNHAENVTYLATEMFDSIRKLHGLGKRERLLLQISAILHSCGAYVNIAGSRENSYKIIMSTEIIGISHKERVIVANMIRYDSGYFPPYNAIEDEISRDEYITIVKLCAILQLANVLDKSNMQKIKRVSVALEDSSLRIVAHTMADITLEKGLFRNKADIFEEAFGIRPVLKKKK